MMLFVNSCVNLRTSRTYRIAEELVRQLGGDVDEIVLEREDLVPLDSERVNRRTALAGEGDFSDPMFDNAHRFADADTVVIAAPYWDFEFPAMLKIYLESVNVVGLTYRYGPDGVPTGMCRASRMYYVTTAGGYLNGVNLGAEVLRSMCAMFGIPEFRCISAEGLDIWGNDADAIVEEAISKIPEVIRD